MTIARRVARAFKAELLTKQWLMGVRRGWISLLKPQIQDWPDVFKAFERLITFVDNLEEQVAYVRRAPAVVLKLDEAAEIKEAFKVLRDKLKDARSRAEHWYRVDREDGGRGTFTKDQGEQMLALYKKDFGALLDTHVKTRPNPKKNQWNDTRPAHLTEHLDEILELLRAQAKRLNDSIETDKGVGNDDLEREYEEPAFKEFNYGRMKVVVTDPKFHGKLISKFLPFISKAKALLERKGFGKLWYGVMFIESDDVEELDAHTQQAYAAMGYQDMRARAGRYHEGEDIFFLTQPPTEWLAQSIVHELGHRYWYKFMNARQRERFESFVKIPRARPRSLEVREVSTTEARANIQSVGDATKASIQAFKAAVIRSKRWAEAIDKNYQAIAQAGHGFQSAMIDAMHSAKANATINPEVKSLFDDALASAAKARTILWEADTSIKKRMMDEPEPTAPIANVDVFWRNALKKHLPAWVEEAERAVDDAVATALIYVEAAVEAYNEVERGGNAKREQEWKEQDEADTRPLPVSQYGRSHIREAFAEVFTFYVYGYDMTQDQLESFRAVLSSQTAESVVSRYLRRR